MVDSKSFVKAKAGVQGGRPLPQTHNSCKAASSLKPLPPSRLFEMSFKTPSSQQTNGDFGVSDWHVHRTLQFAESSYRSHCS